MQAFVIGTQKCNLKCDFCIEKNRRERYDFQKVMNALAGLLDNNDASNTVRISGGEPLADMEYLDGILHEIAPYKEKTEIILFTNGQLLTYDTHEKLMAGCNKLMYLIGISPVPYKSLDTFLINKDAIRIIEEKEASYLISYIIDEIEHLDVYVEDAAKMRSLGLDYRLGYNKHNTQGLDEVHALLRNAVLKTGYVHKPKNLFDFECSLYNILPDGSIKLCQDSFSGESMEYSRKFKEHVCSKCKYRNHCLNCKPMLSKFAYEQCYLTKALCANVSI